MATKKLTEKQIKNIQKLLKEGHAPKDLAKKYGVHISVIYRRAKYDYQARGIPVNIKKLLPNNYIFRMKKLAQEMNSRISNNDLY